MILLLVEPGSTHLRIAKHFAVDGMDCRMSFVLGNGCTGHSMYLLSGEKSVMSLFLPFGLGTKKEWQHHGVGSVTCFIIPWSIGFSTYALA